MYSLSKTELLEVASEIMQCSLEQIRCRTRFCHKNGKIEENPDRICFACSVANPLAKVNANLENGYNLQQQYNDSRFSLRGVGVFVPDKEYFFFSACKNAPEAFIYLEFTRY